MKIHLPPPNFPNVATFTAPVPEDWRKAIASAGVDGPGFAYLQVTLPSGKVVPVQADAFGWDADGDPIWIECAMPVGPETPSLVNLELAPFPLAVDSTPGFHPDLLAPLVDGVVIFRVVDTVGRTWETPVSFRPWDREDDVRFESRGPWKARARDWELLKFVDGPSGAQASGTVEMHPFGLIQRATVHKGSGVALFDFELTNGVLHGEGDEPQAPHALISRIEVVVPSEYTMTRLDPLPMEREVRQLQLPGSDQVVEEVAVVLFDDQGGDKDASVLISRGRSTFRVALHRMGDEAEATFYRCRRNLGFADEADWGGYFYASREYVPPLGDFVESAYELWINRLADVKSALASGVPYIYQVPSRMGHFHALGTSIGYMTGGLEITQTFGADIIAARVREGVLAVELEGDMVQNRHAGDLYRPDGSQVEVGDLIDSEGRLRVSMFSGEFQEKAGLSTLGFGTRDRSKMVGAWGYSEDERPSWWEGWVGSKPWEGFERHDWQHGIRGYYHAKILALLTGDGVSIERLKRESVLARVEEYHGHGGRLGDRLAQAVAFPKSGVSWGRALGHAGDIVATAWSHTSPEERAKLSRPSGASPMDWAVIYQEAAKLAQTPSGAINGNRDAKTGGYGDFAFRWAITQTWEEAMGLRGLFTVARAMLPEAESIETFETLDRIALFLQGTMKPGTNGNFEQVAIADRSSTPGPGFPLSEILIDLEKVNGGPSQDQQVGALFVPLVIALWRGDSQRYVETMNLAGRYLGVPDAGSAKEVLDAIIARGFFGWEKRAGFFGLVWELVVSNVDDAVLPPPVKKF